MNSFLVRACVALNSSQSVWCWLFIVILAANRHFFFVYSIDHRIDSMVFYVINFSANWTRRMVFSTSNFSAHKSLVKKKMFSRNSSVYYLIYTQVNDQVVQLPNECFFSSINVLLLLPLWLTAKQLANQSIKRWHKFHYNCICCIAEGVEPMLPYHFHIIEFIT